MSSKKHSVKKGTFHELIFLFEIDKEDSQSPTTQNAQQKDNGYPLELAKDMLAFWKSFHFPTFNWRKARFGSHTQYSTQVELKIKISSNFTLPSAKRLTCFIDNVQKSGPDTYQEGEGGMLYGGFLDLVDVFVI